MNNQDGYNLWSESYDSIINKTRDLEAKALKKAIDNQRFNSILEIGCGTGKNTGFLASVSNELLAVDFSSEMLAKAQEKIKSSNIQFKQLDINNLWNFKPESFDLAVCSLVLEHIENLEHIFAQARKVLKSNGLLYFGELHPFKQYQGSKARFEKDEQVIVLQCFVHNFSDYFAAAQNNNFRCTNISEWFDDDDKTQIPRILSCVFSKF